MATSKWLVVNNIPENSFFCSTQERNLYRFETMWGWVKRELKKQYWVYYPFNLPIKVSAHWVSVTSAHLTLCQSRLHTTSKTFVNQKKIGSGSIWCVFASVACTLIGKDVCKDLKSGGTITVTC